MRLIVLSLVLSVPAFAQDATNPEIGPPPPPATASEAPYDPQLLRLSEVLGSLHHLRPLCGSREGTKWRDRMGQLLEAENPTGERRDRVVARFNRGYATFARSYKTCTPSALRAADRYTREGVQLSSQIVSRYAR